MCESFRDCNFECPECTSSRVTVRDNAGVIRRNDFVRNGSPQIQRSLRGLRVLTQRLPRGPRGADEPRAIAKQAGFDGNGS